MNLVKWIVVILFFTLGACGPGGHSAQSLTAPAVLEPCTDCSTARIASHAIVFTEMPESTKEALSLAASASHAGMIRMDFTWASLQPAAPPAEYDWHWVDESIRAAKKNNLEILALITETPAWASQNPTDPDARFFPPKPEHFDEWQAFITAFVDRYGAKGTNEIHFWEIWGEANDDLMWKGTAAEFAQFYSIAYDAIKTSDPAATVLMAGMNEADNPGQWLMAVLNDPVYPAKDKIDIIDVHIRGSFDQVKTLTAGWKAVFQNEGIVKPIWITEFGFPTSPVFQSQWNSEFVGANEADGEQKQADYYNTVIPWLLTDGGVDRILVTLRDVDAPGTAWESEGIVTKTVTPKVAFNTIRDLSDRFR